MAYTPWKVTLADCEFLSFPYLRTPTHPLPTLAALHALIFHCCQMPHYMRQCCSACTQNTPSSQGDASGAREKKKDERGVK